MPRSAASAKGRGAAAGAGRPRLSPRKTVPGAACSRKWTSALPRAPHHLPKPQGSTASPPASRTAATLAARSWPSANGPGAQSARTSRPSPVTIWRPATRTRGKSPAPRASSETASSVGMRRQPGSSLAPSRRAVKVWSPAISVNKSQPAAGRKPSAAAAAARFLAAWPRNAAGSTPSWQWTWASISKVPASGSGRGAEGGDAVARVIDRVSASISRMNGDTLAII